MLLAHSFTGYLVGKKYKDYFKLRLKDSQEVFWIILSLISGIAPDLDALVMPIFGIQRFRHRNFPMHYPFFWLGVSVMFFLVIKWQHSNLTKLKKFINPKYAVDVIRLMLLNTLLHIGLDTLVGHIKLLWPLSDRFYTLFGKLVPYYIDSTSYLTHPQFFIEIGLIILAIYIFSKEYNLFPKITELSQTKFVYFGIAVYILFGLTTFGLRFNTYKRLPQNINYNPDLDYDNIPNHYDSDIDQDGNQNIIDLLNGEYDQELEQIINNQKSTKPLSLPDSKSTNALWTKSAQFSNIVKNNQDFVYKIYSELGFRLSNDIIQDTIRSPNTYNFDLADDYDHWDHTLGVQEIYTYISQKATKPTLYKPGYPIFTKDANGRPHEIYIVSSYEPTSDKVNVLTTGNNWKIEEAEIPTEDILPY